MRRNNWDLFWHNMLAHPLMEVAWHLSLHGRIRWIQNIGERFHRYTEPK